MNENEWKMDNDVQKYLAIYDELAERIIQINQTEKLNVYYQEIKKEFIATAQKINPNNCLTIIRDLLLVDSKLQILFFFWVEEDLHFCKEEKIIDMVEKDYKKYHKDAMDGRVNNKLPLPFIFFDADQR